MFNQIFVCQAPRYVPVKLKLQHLLTGIPGAFDALSCRGGGGGLEFDNFSLPEGGALDHQS